MWIFEFSLGVCSTELRNLVPSLKYLVSNGRQVLLGGIRLGGSATISLHHSATSLHGRVYRWTRQQACRRWIERLHSRAYHVSLIATYRMTLPCCCTETRTSIHRCRELLSISPNPSSNLWAIVYLLHLMQFWPALTFFKSTYPQAIEQPPGTDQSYPSHYPSGVNSQQGVEYTNNGAKVHTPLSALARH